MLVITTYFAKHKYYFSDLMPKLVLFDLRRNYVHN